jgi:hypothetical protein
MGQPAPGRWLAGSRAEVRLFQNPLVNLDRWADRYLMRHLKIHLEHLSLMNHRLQRQGLLTVRQSTYTRPTK